MHIELDKQTYAVIFYPKLVRQHYILRTCTIFSQVLAKSPECIALIMALILVIIEQRILLIWHQFVRKAHQHENYSTTVAAVRIAL